jgi:enoyl-CoA hydratase
MVANGPLALKATLEAVHGGSDRPLTEALEGEAALFGELCASSDAAEGTRAFLEKRAPRFEGK